MSHSFWEQDAFATWDALVLGGGIVGLSTAISLAEQAPSLRIAVLDAHTIPTGATTRSAGFACTGSPTELLADAEAMGWSRMTELVSRRWEGLCRLRERLGDPTLDLHLDGGWELLPPERESVLEQLDTLNQHLAPVFGSPPFMHRRDVDFGFSRTHVAHLVQHRFEGGLHPGRLARALMGRADALGVLRFGGLPATALTPEPGGVCVHTSALTLRARVVACCTNAFVRELLPDVALEPGRGQVLLTEPLPGGHPLRGVFHLDEGYVYFRGVGDRVLIGGGRNLAMEDERTTDFGPNAALHNHLERLLREVILPDRRAPISHRWSGIMAFGPTREPVLGEVAPRVFAGVRLGGMGIALGTRLGDQLATLLHERLSRAG